jgi:hypothetical protein
VWGNPVCYHASVCSSSANSLIVSLWPGGSPSRCIFSLLSRIGPFGGFVGLVDRIFTSRWYALSPPTARKCYFLKLRNVSTCMRPNHSEMIRSTLFPSACGDNSYHAAKHAESIERPLLTLHNTCIDARHYFELFLDA